MAIGSVSQLPHLSISVHFDNKDVHIDTNPAPPPPALHRVRAAGLSLLQAGRHCSSHSAESSKPLIVLMKSAYEAIPCADQGPENSSAAEDALNIRGPAVGHPIEGFRGQTLQPPTRL
ncbi:hypothetical protein C5748_12775 [Phyllobacterium phragmitis]|uniref:Uncharacterized protein n=1 Tax=Phyllobacterium phragmitis TaxID=2670329 RepID=A0A2S9IRB9_9HYPH|nr:hypothetical protein C5748_12775 [Phyllobacterium phragmitis]